MPERFLGISFDALDETRAVRRCRDYARNVVQRVGDGMGLILKGPVGTGKTTAACAIAEEACRQDIAVLFLRAYRLVDDLTTYKTFADKGAFDALEARLKEARLLILDDFGQEMADSWAEGKVERILADRYDQMRSTIITTNLGSGDMRQRYQERILDRLRETCEVVVFSGPSRRIQSQSPEAERP